MVKPYVSSLAFTALSTLMVVTPPQVGAVDLTVALNYSTYIGTGQAATGVTQWLGIRYAAPPLGDLRFMPPQDPPVVSTPQLADQHGKYCLATNDAPNDTATSEDCLFLDIYAPSSATPASKLPVYFFIQGGGFNTNSNPNYNGTGLVTASGNNIVVVTFNYRVGLYGFLANGNELRGNYGLHDQRKAMEWVQKYIRQFGGDPSHVTMGGDSAGAASVSLHLTAYGGRDDGLFQAATAESVSFATVLTIGESQYQYDNLALRLGCVGNTSQTLACLRSKSAVEIQNVNYNIPFPRDADPPLYMYNPVIDGDLVRTVTYTAFAEGNFIKVPVIFGDDTNGGTTFVPQNTSTLVQSDLFLRDQFPYLTLEHFATINTLYPNPNNTCPNVGCYWRQASNAYGEMRYMCPGLFISNAYTTNGVPQSWAYRWNVEDPDQVAQGLGVPHTAEINAIWGPYNTNGNAPLSYYPGGVNAHAVPVIQGYWTSFIRTHNPNTYRVNGSAQWVPWDSSKQGRLLFDTGGVTSMENLAGSDLMERCDFWRLDS
ncbi:Cholinesterase [Cytospora mali]|uniref:Cholinesterase n=1 Tax=Cytospora mali TaxID=578113 RepID=A0A194WE36_CYTMA|nr:Cholinesterase [Valsa mali]